ncbi:hypothetical protein [Microbulbifer sp. MCCC 1A16149]|uniref:hypothetical protein n=1 Tax=Microbulbifer sp. MCCC 1A16149 TaxID=3411322 RepID=UPI003D0F47C2
MKRLPILLLLCAAAATAQDGEGEIITLESTIIGSQEQPKVLYIIPWKQANSLEKIESTIPDAISHTFRHQEYSELKREMELLQPQESEE